MKLFYAKKRLMLAILEDISHISLTRAHRMRHDQYRSLRASHNPDGLFLKNKTQHKNAAQGSFERKKFQKHTIAHLSLQKKLDR